MNNDLLKVHELINDLWQFEKKYYPAHNPQDMQYWRKVAESIRHIEQKYSGLPICSLARKLLVACLEDIEARARKEDT